MTYHFTVREWLQLPVDMQRRFRRGRPIRFLQP